MERKLVHSKFKGVRHTNHPWYTLGINKGGLTDFDNKPYYIGCNESSPYGHYKNKN